MQWLKYTVPLFILLALFPALSQASTSFSAANCSSGQCDKQIRDLHALARYGSFEAMTLLSMIYATGDGREADPKRALSFLTRAAQHNHPMAVYLLSEWHSRGFVAPHDPAEAEALLAKAIRFEFPPALYKKALQLLQDPTAENLTEGLALLQRASDKRLVDAMFLLARLKREGIATAPDLEGAAQLFKTLVLSGHEESRPYLRESIAQLTPKPESAELVADLQQSYDMEVIQVIGRDFKTESMLGNMVTQLKRSGLYLQGSMLRIRTQRCDDTTGCISISPRAGDRDLNQTITGSY
ncbi:hypothetical protein GCM10010919_07930 [Alishewanella longhuensis]|uniref:Sel1 repeat family protein n=1 Tax=Alishewanella longhuensis TaxID=1091037 RepID=A0ABQ3KXR1_9ALTE|nr:SEL1-like repeat protein [Alishewanella longhuensis]GHG62543.1 hypothetical protein GCM10010919_07930 [Alishewanella longhuensis]